MSKLEDLIQKYCPDGVEYKPLVECCNILDGKRKPITKGARQSGQYPYYGANGIQDWVAEYIFDGTYILVGEDGSVITPTGTPVVNWAEGQIWVNNHAHILAEKTGVLLRYLFYYIQVIDIHNLVHGNIPKLTQGDLKELEIPVPPLPVQEEIVRILDTFTELQAELQAELQKRKQQYNYYKWSLLESLSCPTKHITDIALVKARVGWQRLTTAEYQATGDYFLITGTDFKNGQIDFNSCVYVSKERYEMDTNIIVGKDDILITKDGTLGKVAILTKEPSKPTTLNSGVFRIHITDEQVSPRYLFHYFTSNYFTDFVESVKTGSTIPHLTQQGLVSLDIPIPSLEEQNRVVAILDKFESITNDLAAGLPAEIEKRRQQYEYYRDKLLTFKRKEA